MKIFYENEIRDCLSHLVSNMKAMIHREDKNQLLNCNETEYVKHYISEYVMDPLKFDWDNISVSDGEGSIHVDDFGRHGFVNCQIITYHVPYIGNEKLLGYKPSSAWLSWTIDIEVNKIDKQISFNIINRNNNPEAIKTEFNRVKEALTKQLEYLLQEINSYNNNLERIITTTIKERKSELLEQSNMLASLGVPIKKKDNVPETFSIPAPIKKTIIHKPFAPGNKPFQPEPTLDINTYHEILKICHGTGVEIERHPDIYRGKDEETLRDYFLMVLSPHFQSAAGETFNKSGKTDILIRHEGKNVFIAECKYWRGIKSYHDTIDQLLSYLTWRDSKAVILCFIKNKELTPVLKQIEENTPRHDCYIKTCDKISESHFQYEFHLKNDNTRGVDLSVMCFHFPE